MLGDKTAGTVVENHFNPIAAIYNGEFLAVTSKIAGACLRILDHSESLAAGGEDGQYPPYLRVKIR